MSQPSSDVQSWVKARLNDVTEGGSVTQFAVVHHIEGSHPEPLGSARVRSDSEPFDVAEEIWNVCEADAQTRMLGRMQRYVVIAYRGAEEDHAGQFAFLMSGKATSEYGGDTEGPNVTGHMGQLMRHTEKLHTSIMQLTEMTAGRLARDLEQERARRIKLEDMQMQNFEARQELLDRQHERAMELATAAKKQARYDEFFDLVKSLTPLVAARVLGPAVGGIAAPELPAAGARDEALHQFLKSLTGDEVQKIFTALDQKKQIVLMELYKAHQDQEQEREEREKQSQQNFKMISGGKSSPSETK